MFSISVDPSAFAHDATVLHLVIHPTADRSPQREDRDERRDRPVLRRRRARQDRRACEAARARRRQRAHDDRRRHDDPSVRFDRHAVAGPQSGSRRGRVHDDRRPHGDPRVRFDPPRHRAERESPRSATTACCSRTSTSRTTAAIGNHVTMSNLAQLAGHCRRRRLRRRSAGWRAIHQVVRIGRYAFVGGYSQARPRSAAVFSRRRQSARSVRPQLGRACAAHGFSREALAELKECVQDASIAPSKNISQAVAALREIVTTDEGRALLAFLESRSERGILK